MSFQYRSQESKTWYNDSITSGHHCRGTCDKHKSRVIAQSFDIFLLSEKIIKGGVKPHTGNTEKCREVLVKNRFVHEKSPRVESWRNHLMDAQSRLFLLFTSS